MTQLTGLASIRAALYLTAVMSSYPLAISLDWASGVASAALLQNAPHFKFKSGASGKTSDGADFSAVSYESSDGIVVSAITETYGSKDQAQRALQKKLRGATRVLSRTPKIAPTGKRLGIRVLARFPLGDRYPPRATILWTDGPELHYVGSISLKHTQEFEKTFY